MKRIVTMVLGLVFMSNLAFAEVTLSGNGLTEKQKAEVAAQIADLKAKNQTADVPTVDKASQWVEVGKNAGLALASCAKEIGVAGDAFLNSTTGKVVFGVVIFKMMGGPIIHVFGSVLILAIGVPIWFWVHQRKFTYTDTFNEAGKRVSRQYKSIDGEDVFIALILLAVIVGASMVVLLTF